MNAHPVINYYLFFFCLTPGVVFYKLQIVRIWSYSALLTVRIIRRIHLTNTDDKIKCHILLHTFVPSVWAILNARFKDVPAGHVFQGCLHMATLAFSICFLLRWIIWWPGKFLGGGKGTHAGRGHSPLLPAPGARCPQLTHTAWAQRDTVSLLPGGFWWSPCKSTSVTGGFFYHSQSFSNSLIKEQGFGKFQIAFKICVLIRRQGSGGRG